MSGPPGYDLLVSVPSKRTAEEETRRRRRIDLLESLREAAELRARLTPRRHQLDRARALLHARTTRG